MDDAMQPAGGGGELRGFSLPALLLTLLVCLALVALALLVVDRTTRIPQATGAAPKLKTSLGAASRALTRDLDAVSSGLLPPGEAVRSLADNFDGSRLFTNAFGQPTSVRPGTDILGLRGVLRAPVLRLEDVDSGEIGRRPKAATVRIAGSPGPGNEALLATAARLRARDLAGPARRFFLVKDAAGLWAVARVTAFDASRLERCGGAAGETAAGACSLELTLDFTDADAVSANPGGSPSAASRLGPLVAAGLYDEVAFFVAPGPAGRPPDFFVVNDPPSMANPHPFLAAAEAQGAGRWEVVRVADDIENLQVAFGLKGGDNGEIWVADRPGSRVEGAWSDAAGQPRLVSVRCALVAVGPRRSGPDTGDSAAALPFNAPQPGENTAPVGWAPEVRDRIAVARESRVVEVRFTSSP
jgi:hypothetical protein